LVWDLKTYTETKRGNTPHHFPSLLSFLLFFLLFIHQMIHLFVEILDRYFGNVCELDIIFNFHKVGRARREQRWGCWIRLRGLWWWKKEET